MPCCLGKRLDPPAGAKIRRRRKNRKSKKEGVICALRAKHGRVPANFETAIGVSRIQLYMTT